MREKDYVFCSDCKKCGTCASWDYGVLSGCFGYQKYVKEDVENVVSEKD